MEVYNKENEQELLMDDLDFNMADTEGFVMGKYYGYDDSTIHGFVPEGKKIKGKLFYDVDDSGKYELTYKPSLHLDEITITFEIEL